MSKYLANEIEEIMLNAFPSVRQEIYDGWLLRFSGGYTYRANCICPLYPSEYPLEEKIAYCEERYRRLHLPVIYKMSHIIPGNLDMLLEKKGYPIVKYVDVLCRSLSDWNYTPPSSDPYRLTVSRQMDDEWLEGVNQLIHIPVPQMENIQKHIFRRIQPPYFCVHIKDGSRIIATGLGVLERGYIGLYAIHVDEAYRRQGLALRLCSEIMRQGQTMGATKAHLQVRHGNTGAFLLYDRLDMKKVYTHWFRMKTFDDSIPIFD